MAKTSEAEKNESREMLREYVKPGQTVFCILRHRAASGMSRVIQLVTFVDGEPRFLGFHTARLCGYTWDRKREGIRISGVGMDMGFALVYELSNALFRGGFGCIGKGCPSNDHANGDRDYTPHYDGTPRNSDEVGKNLKPHSHYHQSGGYALRHGWL